MSPLQDWFDSLPWLGPALLQATALAACGLAAWLILYRRGPALRAAVLAATLAGVLFVPVLGAVSPVWLPLPGLAALSPLVPLAPASPLAHAALPDPTHDPTFTAELANDTEAERAETVDQLPADAGVNATSPLAAEVKPIALRSASGIPARGWSMSQLLAGIWLLGVLLYLLRMAASLATLAQWRRHSRLLRDEDCAACLADVPATTVAVELRECPAIASPLTLGWRRPVILLPAAWRTWDAPERTLILAHELAHVRRRDFLLGVFAELAVCLYWFHPLVRLLARRLRLEQEYAADSEVLAGAPIPMDYLCCLARLALEIDTGSGSLAPAMWRRRPDILRRIDMLHHTNSQPPRTLGRRAAVALGFSTLAVSLLIAGAGNLRSADPVPGVVIAGDNAGQPGAPAPAPAAKANGPTDLHGDPLPPGALARLGTVRYRHAATAVAYAPDGKLLATGGGDNQIRLFDTATGKEVRRLAGHQSRTYQPARDAKGAFDVLVGSVGQGSVTTLAFAPDGKTLASGGWDDSIRFWDVATGKELRKLDAHQAMVARVTFSPDGKLLASRGGIDGILRIWDAGTGKELHKIDGVARVNPWRFYREAALAFAPDSKSVIASDRKGIIFFDVATGKETKRFDGYKDCMYVAFSPDGKLLASGGLDDAAKEEYSLRLWDIAAGKELRRCALPKNEPPTGFAFTPESDKIAALVAEANTFVFDVATGKVVHEIKHYWPTRIALAPDGKTVVTVKGPAVRLWDAGTGKERALEFDAHQGSVSSVAVSPDGKLIATGGEDIRLWEPTGKLVRRLAAQGTSIAFAPEGKTLASVGGNQKTVHLWDVATGKELKKFDGVRLMRAVAFSPDSKLLATGDEQGVVRVYDLGTGQQLHENDMQSGAESLALAFSPDSKTLACAGAWNEGGVPKGITLNLQKRVTITGKEGFLVLLWDATTGKEIRRFAGLKDNVKAIAFSPDGAKLAGSSRDGKICLWDAATGKELLFIEAHPGHVDATFSCTPAIAFAPDGKTLASVGTDKRIRVWDATTGKEIAKLHAPDNSLLCLAYTPDGKKLVTGSADTTVLIWDIVNPVKPAAERAPIILR
ncbi:hypothetical protein AYO44_01860 [Planctomycetaceae bacterium SCGC AG-212-F19]|nr:hypothetical protein AYO44_01860 [Planctomycetaceae bacterium SCGC AG-212-F19]